MKNTLTLLILVSMLNYAALAQNKKELAVTFDDLPLSQINLYSTDEAKEITANLLHNIRLYNVPAVGFVNENKLYFEDRDLLPDRVDLLKMWLDEEVELGNHTHSHLSANKVSIEEFKEDVIRGENILKRLLTERNLPLRYFRHPFLHTGRSLDIKDEINSFLLARGYTIAPVTVDNSELIYYLAYRKALEADDTITAARLGNEYVAYMIGKIKYFEGRANELFGRNIKQILLVHANLLNADYFDDLCAELKKSGYTFITMGEALTDEAYNSEDKFTGAAGISWLDRWALTMGKEKDFFKDEPRVPENILKYAGIESE